MMGNGARNHWRSSTQWDNDRKRYDKWIAEI